MPSFFLLLIYLFFFFNDTATTEIYTLSLHDALPISGGPVPLERPQAGVVEVLHPDRSGTTTPDRKSTRLNSSHANISYAVFCLKKKKKISSQEHRHHTGINITQLLYQCFGLSCASYI